MFRNTNENRYFGTSMQINNAEYPNFTAITGVWCSVSALLSVLYMVNKMFKTFIELLKIMPLNG